MKKIILMLIGLVFMISCSQQGELKTIEKNKMGIITNSDDTKTVLTEGRTYHEKDVIEIIDRYKTFKYESSIKKDDTTRVDITCDIEIDLSRLHDSTYVITKMSNIDMKTYHMNKYINSLLEY